MISRIVRMSRGYSYRRRQTILFRCDVCRYFVWPRLIRRTKQLNVVDRSVFECQGFIVTNDYELTKKKLAPPAQYEFATVRW
jgi:hypothetical protein